MTHYEIIGWISSLFTATFLIPQIVAMIKTKNTNDVSYISIVILIMASCCWSLYGFLTPEQQPQVYVVNIIQGVFSICILILKICSEKKKIELFK